MRDRAARRAEGASVPLDAAIAERAARRHGVVSRAQLRGLGLSDSAVSRALARGRLHPVHRGVFAVGHRLLAARGHWMAAVLAAGRGTWLSHVAAGTLWEIRSTGSRLRFTWRQITDEPATVAAAPAATLGVRSSA